MDQQCNSVELLKITFIKKKSLLCIAPKISLTVISCTEFQFKIRLIYCFNIVTIILIEPILVTQIIFELVFFDFKGESRSLKINRCECMFSSKIENENRELIKLNCTLDCVKNMTPVLPCTNPSPLMRYLPFLHHYRMSLGKYRRFEPMKL